MSASSAAKPSVVTHALKDALIAGIVAFGLFVLLLGFLADDTLGKLRPLPRPVLLAAAVGIVFVGRFLVSLLYYNAAALRLLLGELFVSILALAKRFRFALLAAMVALAIAWVLYSPGDWPLATMIVVAILFAVWLGLTPALLALAVLFPIAFYSNPYYLGIAIIILTYVMLGWGLNIVVGLAGLLDLGYVAFYAVGAYSYAIIAQAYGWSFWVCLPLAGLFAAFFGVLLGFPVLRLRGDYLAIVTLAFGEIVRIVLLNWVSLTNGPNGIGSIPRASFFGIPFTADDDGFAARFGFEFDPTHRTVFLFYLILALALITNWVTIRLRKLPVGRAWEALREDEIAVRSLGINPTNTKLTAFAIGAMFGGFAGAFFATRQGFISPDSFTFPESALILAIVVLGGMGSQIGVAIAAIVMTASFELFREFEQFRLVIFGFAMVGIMIWRPRGLISSREPSVYLKERKTISAEHVAEGHG
ncbi:MAG: high-affinity branched-chain amino acid ABC transporter permease LivM [Xanthobacteraceae bacterium]|nr:high-affinity branched-chain amino acid ABC transporter permease LivM [Xanthobacteraceae bacterium]MCW5679123.1 high-affinity branched-chain amino acid ABC transporter permease LivM [Xanthobacteraceae bacterium]